MKKLNTQINELEIRVGKTSYFFKNSKDFSTVVAIVKSSEEEKQFIPLRKFLNSIPDSLFKIFIQEKVAESFDPKVRFKDTLDSILFKHFLIEHATNEAGNEICFFEDELLNLLKCNTISNAKSALRNLGISSFKYKKPDKNKKLPGIFFLKID